MAITSRAALKAQFKSGSIPAAQDFFNLIDSVLVKRDDAFFGKWQPGISYHTGDVVIYQNALYSCVADGSNPCGCEPATGTDTPPASDGGTTTTDANPAYCSTIPPTDDTTHWQLLRLDLEDEDWAVVRGKDGQDDIMYAKVFGNIGMGTETPQGRVHIHDDKVNADYIFSPTGGETPSFVIAQAGETNQQLTEGIAANQAQFTTNTSGFLFTLQVTPPPATVAAAEGSPTPAPAPATNNAPVFITAPNGSAQVGVGTIQPTAAVDAQPNDAVRALLNPSAKTAPNLTLLHTDEYAKQVYLGSTATKDTASITHNAPNGLYIRKGPDNGEDYTNNDTPTETTHLAIKPDGKIGAGTETPRTALEVTDGKSGSVLVSFENVNPAFCVFNLRSQPNYLTIGVDNDVAIFVADGGGGYAFRKGTPYGQNGAELNINQGDDLMVIKAGGNVGIGIDPEEYKLEVLGNVRTFTLYLDTDTKRIKEYSPMGSVMDKVKLLNPVRFRWNAQRTGLPDDKDQLGFLAHEVADAFPEVVNTHKDNTRAVAYPNLVAVLTKALQEQQQQIAALDARIKALETAAKGPRS